MARLTTLVCLLVLLLSLLCTQVQCAKILCVLAIPSYSHYVLLLRIMEEMAQKGHQVTLLTPYQLKKPVANIRDIPVLETVQGFAGIRKNLFELHEVTVFYNIHFILSASNQLTAGFLSYEPVQKLMKSNETFDAVVLSYFQNEALMGLAHHFKAPLIMVSPMPPTAWTNHLVANPNYPSYMPYMQSSFSSDMNFYERFLNTIYDHYYHIRRELVAMKEQERLYKKYFPNSPELSEVRQNVTIFLVNAHESINNAVPHVPNMIQIGGSHVSPPKPLPEHLKNYLDSAKEGVVLFSMGSNLRSAELPPKMRDDILRAFSKIKQKVLWKFEEDLPNLPPNVKIEKWLPQQDVLAHPNIVAFITHGGLMSSIEAVHYGVPLVGLPVFGDQKMNIAKAVTNGYAVSLPLQELNDESLLHALNEVLYNPKYRDEVKRRSRILHDQQMKPVDSAIYWIEYAIRHQGAPHLRTAALKLNWFQRNSLDVYSTLLAILFILFYTLKSVIKLCFCRSRGGKVVKKEKKNI